MKSESTCLKEDDWITDIKDRLMEGKITDYKTIRHFHVEEGILYLKAPTGVLARCLSKEEAIEKIKEIHEQVFGIVGTPLARRLLQAGYYWEIMQKDAQKVQEQCNICKMAIIVKEAIMLVKLKDWRKVYLDYLIKGVVLDNQKEEQKLQRHITKYLKKEGHLNKKAYNREILKCINDQEAKEFLKEIHEGDCGEHQGGRRLYEEALHLGHFWSMMEKDAMNYV